MCWCPLYIYLQVQAPAHVQLRAQQWSTLSPTTQHFTTAWTPQFFPHITPFCVYIISLLSPLKQHLPEFYCSLFEHNFRARDQAAGAWGGAETIFPALFWPVLRRLHFPVWLRIGEQCLPWVNPEQALLYLFGWCLPGHTHLFICCCPFAVEQHSIFISVPWLQDHTRGSLWPSLGVLAARADWPGPFSLAALQSEGTDTVLSVADVQHHPWQGKTQREISVFMQELCEASPVSGVSWSDQYRACRQGISWVQNSPWPEYSGLRPQETFSQTCVNNCLTTISVSASSAAYGVLVWSESTLEFSCHKTSHESFCENKGVQGGKQPGLGEPDSWKNLKIKKNPLVCHLAVHCVKSPCKSLRDFHKFLHVLPLPDTIYSATAWLCF